MSPQGSTGELVSDWSLLERVVRKDESALSALYDRYSGLVFSEAKRILRDTGAAEEILQDLFYQVWRTAERFDAARGSLAGWLLVAARNRAISRLRRALARVYSRRCKQSPEGQRQAVELAYFEGMSHTEIAEKTGQPLGTVKTRIRTAIETLKQVLR